MELRIPENRAYVHNPTDEWYSCEVKNSEGVFKIEVIPPRSIRSFPKGLANEPKLQHIYRLLPDQIERYSTKSTGARLILEPIILNACCAFRGTFEDGNNRVTGVSACFWFSEVVAHGFFRREGDSYVHLAAISVNPSSHHMSMTVYHTESTDFSMDMKGRIDIIEECFHIDVCGNNTRIILDMPKDDKEVQETDFFFTGSYLAFYARGDNEIQMDITLKAFQNGFVRGCCKENSGKFEIIGFVIRETGKIFLIRFNTTSLEKPFYMDGSYSEDGSITITGTWKCESKYGEFFLSKSD